MRQTEERFKYRIQKLLESKGWLVINCARSKPFDLIAIKNMCPVIIELKGKKTMYRREQLIEQTKLCSKTGNEFIIIRQSKKKGKIIISEGYSQGLSTEIKNIIERDLKKWVE